MFEDLAWLGLDWDEPVLVQSQRTPAYQAALDDLKARGLVYACFCTRADIAQSLTARTAMGDLLPRHLPILPDDPERRATTPHAGGWIRRRRWRSRACRSGSRLTARAFTATANDIGDAILARKDAPASYHLACVVDDAASGVTMVVRGADLRASTPIQRMLQELLGLPEPAYLHHPLITHEDGRRLAKRDLAPTLAAMRE